MINHIAHIRARDKVTILTPQGQELTGRANALLIFPNHVVIDYGRGRPAVADNGNIVHCDGCRRA